MLCGGLLGCKLGIEPLLCLGDHLPIALGVDPDLRAFSSQAGQLLLHVKITAMRAEKNIARQGAQLGEGAFKILRDAGIGGWPGWGRDEPVGAERGVAANDDDVERVAFARNSRNVRNV